ncbi:MAG: hypothetical protein CL955_06845 [Erythrobacteraceae bacterium]|nr:hypothetical protein [Erythrobacteraceae bacterium]
MAVTDTAITLGAILLLEAPDGDVLLSDGGIVKFDPGTGTANFDVFDDVFGTVADFEAFETGVGDMVEGGSITFQPAFAADVADWWRTDLEGSRLRIWMGEIASDGVTLEDEELVADWLVDTAHREQSAGQDLLRVEFMSRLEKLFEVSQGNVCSDRFHQSIWSGERGFENCHDGPQYFAWGTDNPPAGSTQRGGSGGGNGGARGEGGVVNFFGF